MAGIEMPSSVVTALISAVSRATPAGKPGLDAERFRKRQ
jgi:hypothetical protein